MATINPGDLSALNSAVRAEEGFSAANRGAQAVLERISAARDSAGLKDHEIFQALARGAGKRSGLYWLCKINGTLSEYLTSWGAVAFIGVSVLGTIVAVKQNASNVWKKISEFVTKHPFITAAGAFGLGAAGGYAARGMFQDGDDSATARASAGMLESLVKSALPAPIVMLAGDISAPQAPIIQVPTPSSVPPSDVDQGGYASLVSRDAYDAQDAYDAYDAYDAEESEYDVDDDAAGNIGN